MEKNYRINAVQKIKTSFIIYRYRLFYFLLTECIKISFTTSSKPLNLTTKNSKYIIIKEFLI
nr:MAG TPA: hypothetical protein [Caudoviricetes sp.]